MGKRRRKHVAEDPILIQKKKKIKPNSTEKGFLEKQIQINKDDQSYSSEIDVSDIEDESEQKDNYQQFLSTFNISNNEQKLERLKYIKTLQQFNFDHDYTQNPENSKFEQHFNEAAIEKLIEEKLEVIEKTKTVQKSQNQIIKEKMKEIFSLSQNQNQQKEQEIQLTKTVKQQKSQDELINKLDIRDFKMKNQFKSRLLLYSQAIQQEILIDLNNNSQQVANISNENDQKDKDLNYFWQNSMKNYKDLIFFDKEEQNAQEFRKNLVEHILNHVSKYLQIRDEKNENPEIIMKGYTKPTVLILTPYKGDAHQIIQEIINQYTQKDALKKVTNRQKYIEQFEYPENFSEDDFRIGISIGINKKVKLFSPFQYSDIIISSPLGLKLNLLGENNKYLKRNSSFLSSIEICYLDRASTILMQNWEHLEQIFEQINKIPKHQDMTSGIDEIRTYFFDNLHKFFRQTIVFSEFNFPELNSFRMRQMNNFEGCIQNKPFYEFNYENNSQFSQEFVKIDITDFHNESDERFQYFKNKIWENWRNEQQYVIFCSSYLSYLKLKNYLTKINASFQCVSEYTPKQKIQQRIQLLLKKTIKFILFSERAYFYDLCQIRKMKHVLFYQLPQNDFIYHKMIQDIQDRSQKTKIQALFTKYDSMAVERIVGTENSQKFLAEYNKSTNFIL